MNGYSALLLKFGWPLIAIGIAWGALNSRVGTIEANVVQIKESIDFLMKWHMGPPRP